MTFDTFYDGADYADIVATARAVANGETRCNPLILYGPSSVGKTHLLHAIAAQTECLALYISAKELARDLCEAIKQEKLSYFYEKYGKAQMLLIDNFEYLGNKTETLTCLYDFFDTYLQNGNQLILAVTRCVPLVDAITERLHSCHPLHMPVPALPTKLAILEGLLKEMPFTLPDDLKGVLAQEVRDGVLLSDRLNMIRLFFETYHRTPTVEEIARPFHW